MKSESSRWRYNVERRMGKVLARLRSLAKKSSDILLNSDPVILYSFVHQPRLISSYGDLSSRRVGRVDGSSDLYLKNGRRRVLGSQRTRLFEDLAFHMDSLDVLGYIGRETFKISQYK